MAKTANELLQGILTVVSRIDSKIERDTAQTGVGPRAMMTIGANLSSFGRVRERTKKSFVSFMRDISEIVKDDKGKSFEYFSRGITKISTALPDLVDSLKDLGRMRTRRVNRSLETLTKLYDLMAVMGSGRNFGRVTRAARLFRRMGRALSRIARPLGMIASFLGILGVSFVVFAGGIVAAAALLRLSSPLEVMGVVLGTITVLVGTMAVLSGASRLIRPGIRVIRGIGAGFMFLSLGLLGFAMGLLLVSSYLGTGSGHRGIWQGLLVMGGVVLAIVGMFALLGAASPLVRRGTAAISGMGFGLLVLVGGIFMFTLGLVGITALLNLSNDRSGILLAMGVMTLTVIGIVGIFALLGAAAPLIGKGLLAAIGMSIGLAAIGTSVLYLSKIAQQLGEMGRADLPEGTERRGRFSSYFREVGPGLGIIGAIYISAALLFVALGAAAVFIAPGIGISLLISGALIALSYSVSKLSKTASKLADVDIADQIKFLIGGSIEGLIGGMEALTGGASGLRGLRNFIKNSAQVFAAIGILGAMSVSLSMFARAISAFANINNMRVIEGHDDEGRPIFGERVNLTNVADTITYTISTFLAAIIESTDGLTRRQARGIRRMARALVGRRGILTAVIQFADALKVYSEFGDKNQIGYLTYDEDGNEVREFVSADSVVDNMINTFLYFTNRLFSRSESEFGDGEPGMEGMSRRQRRRVRRMSRALTGEDGVLAAVVDFSRVLSIFAKYGADNKIPVLDPDGKPTGEYLEMETIAHNIVRALTTFSDILADRLDGRTARDASRSMRRFEGMITSLNRLATSMDGLQKLNLTINELAEGIGNLVISMDKLDTAKLEEIAKKTASAHVRQPLTPGAGGAAAGETTVVHPAASPATPAGADAPQNWREIAELIGEQVGQTVAGTLRNGQFVFEFDTTKSGGVYYWDPK